MSTSTILANLIAPHMEELDSEWSCWDENPEPMGMNQVALYLVNTMQIFSKMSRIEKTSYLEGVVSGEWCLHYQHLALCGKGVQGAIVAGGERIEKVYEPLLNNIVETTGLQIEVQSLIVPQARAWRPVGSLNCSNRMDILNR